jgi:LPXTG-motif cell wall-anchored protein
MKLRKIMSVLLALIFVMAMSTTVLGAALIYDGANDLKSGLSGTADWPGYAGDGDLASNGSGRLCKAGDPSVHWSDDTGLRVYNLVNGWDSIDFLIGGLNGKYRLVVEFAADFDSTFVIGNADSPWGDVASGDGQNVTVTYEFEAANGMSGEQNRFRLNHAERDDFYIKSIKLYDLAATGASGASAKTSDSNFLFVSIAGLILSAGALVLLRRRATSH